MSKENVLTSFLENEMIFLHELSKSYMYMANHDNLRYDYLMKQSREYNTMYLDALKLVQQEKNSLKQTNNLFDFFNR